MKENPYHGVPYFRYLKKFFMDLKILILVLLLGASNILSGFELQQITVTGTVTDAARGDAMPGVNVIIKGTVLGALTGPDGKYSLAVSDRNAILVFSFIGYNTLEQPLSGRTTVNVTLVSSTTELQEVIVTGYGTQKKRDVSTSISSVSAEALKDKPVASFTQAIQGQMAGIRILNSNNAPGGGTNIIIRGLTSFNASNNPLTFRNSMKNGNCPKGLTAPCGSHST